MSDATPTDTPPTPIRVLIADDQRVVRDGLAMLVGLLDGIEVVATADNGLRALEQAMLHRPDVVMMDLHMPHMDGVQATRGICTQLPDSRVVVLTTYVDDTDLFPALQAGARGYLTKDATAEEIRAAIHAVAAGQTHLAPDIQQRLITAAINTTTLPATHHITSTEGLPDGLTPREAEVLTLIAAGLSNSQIARTLVVSEATVKTHINHILAKTGARDRAQAVRYAYHHGLTQPTSDDHQP
ncbi:MAG TPA: response regulator transcription factor [Microlunatus sp.]|nr:response regulator transcription factor [Microlunatus sp.]